jgi:hypothetical protein
MAEFQSIMDGWPQDLIDRTIFKLGQDARYCPTEYVDLNRVADHKYNLITTFHELATAKVLLMSKSGLSYTAGILNENDVFWVHNSARGQKIPLDHWIKTDWSERRGATTN